MKGCRRGTNSRSVHGCIICPALWSSHGTACTLLLPSRTCSVAASRTTSSASPLTICPAALLAYSFTCSTGSATGDVLQAGEHELQEHVEYCADTALAR